MIHILFFILGCCIGSFINVIFSRKDWYKGRSRCDECGYILKWYDLIPLLSFLLLGGRCRKCKTKIDCSHLVSELMMGAAFLVSSLCFDWYGITYGLITFTVLLSIAVAAIEDFKEQMVYSFVLIGGIILSAGVKCGLYIYAGLYIDAIYFLAKLFMLKLVSILVSVACKEKIGSGDFDVLVIIYIIGGLSGLVLSLTFASLIGCIIFLPPVILKKRDEKDTLAFIPLLLMGTMCYLLI